MQIAFYKGDWSLGSLLDDPSKYIAEAAICIGTLSKYSHAELVIDGVCWSSSVRDGGVRQKQIDLDSGHWDVYEVLDVFDEAQALEWFKAHEGNPYDWMGIVRFVLPFVKQRPDQFFCSEAVATALGYADASKMTPKDLLQFVNT